ncbi:hypothetical protein HYFRA_00006302 [Hymenoscyphus fraxineus]|uniref:DUF676 domain-containing protein n=1 Tax=Hymenoscyphus fraxineus TaxID=746836 RepID=A0A9N9PPA1_9HELO|nr:hypothetical protein HYFRA_00006302 [Hymenoscyphus fraxineus]
MNNFWTWLSSDTNQKETSREETLPVVESTPSTMDADSLSTAGPFGIKVMHEPTRREDVLYDIFLIHGLTGNRDKTWRHATWTAENKRSLPEFLAKDFPYARIMVYGYDANVLNFWKPREPVSLEDTTSFGGGLALAIKDSRPAGGSQAIPPERPMYFIMHSLGGLVTEQALLRCINGEDDLKPLSSAAKGLIFLGVPHQGSYYAVYASRITKILPNAVWSTNKAILENLKTNNDNMRIHLEQPFQRAAKEGQLKHLQMFSFYETSHHPKVNDFIVPQHSAVLAAYPHGPIPGHHETMSKFSGRDDDGYKRIKGRLGGMIEEDNKRTEDAKKKAAEDANRNAAPSPATSHQGSNFSGNINAGTFDARVNSAGRDNNANTTNYYGSQN